MKYDIKSIKLAASGKKRIEWADRDMPVLRDIREEFKKNKPLKGIRISACLHVTSETANLMRTLKEGGAETVLCASNPLSTQDEVAASLVKDYGISVFAITGINNKGYYKHLNAAISIEPHITMDDGADLISTLHKKRKDLIKNILGGTEETTTGVIRLKAMAAKKVLEFPVIAVNDSYTKYLFDNRYGTGQSTMDGILRSTNRLIAGSVFTVAGYGWCGKGTAMRAKGMGANVIITEVDPIKALEAHMDGFRVMKMNDACKTSDFIVTVTGDINVIDKHHFKSMKDGCIIANSGHFDVEINTKALKKMSKKITEIRDNLTEYMVGKKNVYLLANGRLVNLSSAEGHPACVMDMSFANQALGATYILKNYKKMKKDVYKLPDNVDSNIAKRKMRSLSIKFDTLTPEQKEYLSSWQIGT